MFNLKVEIHTDGTWNGHQIYNDDDLTMIMDAIDDLNAENDKIQDSE